MSIQFVGGSVAPRPRASSGSSGKVHASFRPPNAPVPTLAHFSAACVFSTGIITDSHGVTCTRILTERRLKGGAMRVLLCVSLLVCSWWTPGHAMAVVRPPRPIPAPQGPDAKVGRLNLSAATPPLNNRARRTQPSHRQPPATNRTTAGRDRW